MTCMSLFSVGVPLNIDSVNSLTFAGINIYVFEAKPCSQGLIFAVSSGLANYLGT